MYLVLKKCVSLSIVLTFLANQCLPVYAGQTKKSGTKKKTYGSQKQKSASDKFAEMQGKVSQKVEEAEQNESPEYWINLGEKLATQACQKASSPVNCVHGFLMSLEAGNQDPTKSFVCIPDSTNSAQKTCLNAITFAQGGLSAVAKNKWLYSKGGNAISANADDATALVTQYGVFDEATRKALVSYFSAVVDYRDCNVSWTKSTYQAALNYVGSKSMKKGIREEAENRSRACAHQVAATVGLAFLAGKGKAYRGEERKQAADRIYSFLKSSYESADGAAVLTGSVAALMLLNTERSWNYIYDFLTSESLPTLGGDLLDLLSVKGLTGQSIGYGAAQLNNSTRYYNRVNEKYSYVDADKAHAYGYRYPDKNSPGIQYPYTNVLEEVGYAIGTNALSSPGAKKIASAYMTAAKDWAISRKNSTGRKATLFKYHWPVVVGLMDGFRVHGNKYKYAVPIEVYDFLYFKGDFWDVNEGTQRRIRDKAYESLKLRGSHNNLKRPQRDDAKWKRYKNIKDALETGEVLDIALIVYAIPALIKSVPALARGITGGVKVLASRQAWIGARDWIQKLPQYFKATAKAASKAEKTVATASTGGKGTATTKNAFAAAKKGAGKPSASSAPKRGAASVQGSKGGASSAKAGGKTSSAASSSSTGSTSVAKGAGNGAKGVGKEATPSRSGNNTAKVKEDVTSPLDEKVQAAKDAPKSAAERLTNPNAPKPDTKSSLMAYVEDVSKALWRAGTEGSQNLGIMPKIPSLNPFAGFSDAWKAVRAERQAATAATQAGETAGQATTAAQRAAAATGKTGAGIEVRGVRLKDGQTFGQVSTQTGRTAGQGAARTENVTATASQQTARVSEATKPLTPAQQAARERAAQSAERIAKGADDRVARLERQLDLAETESARQYHRALEADAKGYSGTVETASRASWNADKRAEQLRAELETAKKQAAAAHEEHQAAVARSEMGRPMASEQPAPRTTEPVRTESAKPSEPVKTEAPKPTEQASSAASAEEAVSREEAAVKRAAQHRDVAGERKAAARQQRREAVEAQGKAADDLREAQKAQKEAQESVKTAQKQTEAARKQYQEATERYRQATKKQGNAQQAAAQERYDELRAQVQQAREAEQEAYKDMAELGKEQKALEKDLAEASKRAEQAQDAAYQAKKDADAARKAADETAKKGTWTSAYKNAEANAQKAAAKAEEAQRKAAKAGERVKDIEGKIGEKSSAHAKAREKYDSAKKLVESRDEEAVALSKEVTAAEKVVEEEQALQKAQRASAEALADARQAEAQAVEQARQASEKVTASDGRLQEARKAIQQADAEIERADKAYKEAEAALSQRVKEAKQAAASSSRPATSAQPTQSTGRKVFTI